MKQHSKIVGLDFTTSQKGRPLAKWHLLGVLGEPLFFWNPLDTPRGLDRFQNLVKALALGNKRKVLMEIEIEKALDQEYVLIRYIEPVK